MASRKALKKNVNYIAGELFAECLMNSLYVPGTDKKKADELMGEILKMQDEFISRISHTEPGNVKGYYNLKSATIIQYTIKGRFMSR